MDNRQTKLEMLNLLLQKQIVVSRQSFWQFCKTIAPDFYKDTRQHLKLLCDILQALYEGRVIRTPEDPTWRMVENVQGLEDYDTCSRLMLNMPPRFGKSRTLILFCEWILGKNIKNRIITCSYNDDMASDFSRYTRDGIMQEKSNPDEIVYSDIFPNTRIKDGNASFEKWALDGQFFTYKGAGVGGSITGKGGNVTIIDDPIKDADTAFNEGALNKIWKWYTGTFLSRAEGERPLEIINMTRWSKKDICGRILDGPEADEWYVLKLEAKDSSGKLLCPELLGERKYKSLKLNMDSIIFEANYHQKPVDVKGRLYQSFVTYKTLPITPEGHSPFEKVISYTDTADKGTDYLVSLIGGVIQGEIYVLDVYISQKGMEVTEPGLAKFFYLNYLQYGFNYAKIESNNGGRGYARNVERLLWENHKTRAITFKWFHQSKNKQARILSNSNFVMQHMYFPEDWASRWPLYYKMMTEYNREGANTHDDPQDATTGLAEMINEAINVNYDKKVYNKGMGIRKNIYARKGGRVF